MSDTPLAQGAEDVAVEALLAMYKKPQISANPRLIAKTVLDALVKAGLLNDREA